MATINETAVIRAPLEDVFDYRLELRNLPEYNPDVSELCPLSDGPPGEGSAYRFRVRLLGRLTVGCKLTIESVDRPRQLAFVLDSLLRAREVCTFEEVDGATRVSFETTVDTRGGPLVPVIDRFFVVPSARRQLRSELSLMKRHLERSV